MTFKTTSTETLGDAKFYIQLIFKIHKCILEVNLEKVNH